MNFQKGSLQEAKNRKRCKLSNLCIKFKKRGKEKKSKFN